MLKRGLHITILISLVGVLGLLVHCSRKSAGEQPEANVSIIEHVRKDTMDAYGIPVDQYEVVHASIKNNQFLADILLKYKLSYPEIDKLVKASKDVFDPRRIVPGKHYSVYCRKDENGKAAFFIYEPNELEYIVFDLRDSVRVYLNEKEIEYREQWAEGTIETSLYETFQGIGVTPVVAMELSDIYAWTIDFYRIQKGDAFKVHYTEKIIEGETVGVGEILACEFVHSGEHLFAFRFAQDSVVSYFDEKGNSLRKAFLKAPLKFSRISSGYSRKRFHPVQKRWKAHLGTDYAAPTGTPIMAVGDGKVTAVARGKYNGRYVKIRHNGTYTTQYLHMSRFAKGMKRGKFVRQGDIIGYVGSTGLATGPHVCFRFWKNGKQVDHRREKLPPSTPVKKEFRKAFFEHVSAYAKDFNRLIEREIEV